MVVISFLICVKAGAQTTSGNPVVDARILATAIAGGASQKQAILNIINANSPVHYNDYTSMINGLDPKLVTFLGLPPANAVSAQITSSALNVNSRGQAQGTPLSPTDGIDALSSFIAARFKQEIEIAFLALLDQCRKGNCGRLSQAKGMLECELAFAPDGHSRENHRGHSGLRTTA